MPEQNGAGATPGPDATSGQPANGDQNGNGAPPATDGDPQQLGEAGLEALRREREALRAARDENRQLSERLRGFEAQVSDVERLTGRNAELERTINEQTSRIQELLVDLTVMRTAPDLGITKPHIAARLLDRASVEFDDQGNPKNIDALLRKLIETDGDVLAPGGATTVVRGPQGGAQPPGGIRSLDRMIRQAAGYE